jgi:hypothetical protein
MNNTQQLAALQQQIPEFDRVFQTHRKLTLMICAGVAAFALIQIFKGWKLHQLATQFFGALIGGGVGFVAAIALRGLVFKTPFALDTPLIVLAVPLCLIGMVISFKIARFDVTTLARTGLTIEDDGVHTVYGVIWGHAFVGGILFAGAIFCAAAALGLVPEHREHYALLTAAIIALVIGIKGAAGQTGRFFNRGP